MTWRILHTPQRSAPLITATAAPPPPTFLRVYLWKKNNRERQVGGKGVWCWAAPRRLLTGFVCHLSESSVFPSTCPQYQHHLLSHKPSPLFWEGLRWLSWTLSWEFRRCTKERVTTEIYFWFADTVLRKGKCFLQKLESMEYTPRPAFHALLLISAWHLIVVIILFGHCRWGECT